jgi:hypothetical protein
MQKTGYLPVECVVVVLFDGFVLELIRQENVRRWPISKQFCCVVNNGRPKIKNNDFLF